MSSSIIYKNFLTCIYPLPHHPPELNSMDVLSSNRKLPFSKQTLLDCPLLLVRIWPYNPCLLENVSLHQPNWWGMEPEPMDKQHESKFGSSISCTGFLCLAIKDQQMFFCPYLKNTKRFSSTHLCLGKHQPYSRPL